MVGTVRSEVCDLYGLAGEMTEVLHSYALPITAIPPVCEAPQKIKRGRTGLLPSQSSYLELLSRRRRSVSAVRYFLHVLRDAIYLFGAKLFCFRLLVSREHLGINLVLHRLTLDDHRGLQLGLLIGQGLDLDRVVGAIGGGGQ